MFRFYREGISGFPVTIGFYLFLLALAWGNIRDRVWRYNVLAVLLILFAGETYLRVSKKGKLNYTERNSTSVFERYYSLGYGDKRNVDGLYINDPNTEFTNARVEYHYQHRFNEAGLRELPLDSFSGKRNILVIGDSFTEGMGAPADSTGPAALQYFLQRAGFPHRVINAGVSGSDLYFGYRLLERLGPKLHPELVILHLNSSDAFDVIVRGDDMRFAGKTYRYRKQIWWEYPFSFSYILREIQIGIFHQDPNDYYRPEEKRFVLQAIARKISDYKRWCENQHAQFLLVNIPNPQEILNRDFFFDQLLTEPSLEAGIPYVYLRNFMLDRISDQHGDVWSYYYPIDMHLRPAGYWAWGEAVAHDIGQLGLLDSLPRMIEK